MWLKIVLKLAGPFVMCICGWFRSSSEPLLLFCKEASSLQPDNGSLNSCMIIPLPVKCLSFHLFCICVCLSPLCLFHSSRLYSYYFLSCFFTHLLILFYYLHSTYPPTLMCLCISLFYPASNCNHLPLDF